MVGLPKTYRDACEAATSLGFSHIWIDSLCIIQDDIADWEKESAEMGRIYEGATVNIAATWAADSSLGLYHARDPATVSAPELGEGKTTLAPARMYTDDIGVAPLNTRAWVLQERYLAPGQLSFTRNQVYWECQELTACELFPGGMPKELWKYQTPKGYLSTITPPVGKPTVEFEDIASAKNAWRVLVKTYSSCYLTKSSDKLVALAGLAGKVRETLADTYLAGMWRKELPSELCWISDSNYLEETVTSRIRGCWIPTWSWASLDRPIKPDPGFISLAEPGDVVIHFAEVLDVRVSTDHPSGLYNFTACHLNLRAVLIWGKLLRPWRNRTIHEHDLTFKPLSPSPLLGDRGTPSHTSVYWDEHIPSGAVPCDKDATERIQSQKEEALLFAIIFARLDGTSYSFRGLILKMNVDGFANRLGLFELTIREDSQHLQELLLSRPGLVQDENDSGPKVRFDDPGLTEFVRDIIVV